MRLIGDSPLVYRQLSTPESKAELVYQLLLKVVGRADFKVSFNKHEQQPRLRLHIVEGKSGFGSRHTVIQPHDIAEVLPLLLQRIANITVAKPQEEPSLNHNHNHNHNQFSYFKLPPLFGDWWGEDTNEHERHLYEEWERWVMEELREICDDNACKSYGIDDPFEWSLGLVDEICGNYKRHDGSADTEFHCYTGPVP